MSKNGDHNVNTDFNLFDNIMKDVETKKREEEEFFNVGKRDADTTIETSNYDMMEVDTRDSHSRSSQSVQIDTITSTSTPLNFHERFMSGDSRCNSGDVTFDKLEDNNPKSADKTYMFGENNIENSFEGIGSQNGESLSPYERGESILKNKNNSSEINEDERQNKIDNTRDNEAKYPARITYDSEEKDNNSEEEMDEHLISDFEDQEEKLDELKKFVRSNFLNESEAFDEDERGFSDGEEKENDTYIPLANKKEDSFPTDHFNEGNGIGYKTELENNRYDSFENINIKDEEGTFENINIKDEEGKINEKIKYEEANENEKEYLNMLNPDGEILSNNEADSEKADHANFLEEILENLPNDIINNDSEKLGEETNEQNPDKETQESDGKKLKRVVFKRRDTFDELGDRRYDVSGLEQVSEDECEFVNLQEVQQARKDLAEFTMDMGNFNHIINELEKPPEEKKPTEIFLDELLDGTENISGAQEMESIPNSEITTERKKKVKKTKKNPNKKKKKNGNEKDIMYNNVCKVCNNPIIKNGSYPELTEIFSDNLQCNSCCSAKKPSSHSSRDKPAKNKFPKDEKENRITDKAVIRPALDSRLEATENAALHKWLKEKKRAEKQKQRQERKDKNARSKERMQMKIAEEQRIKIAQQKVEEWEERKRKVARENKRMNISTSFKTDRSKPIQHSQNKIKNNHHKIDLKGPRSDSTFERKNKTQVHHFPKRNLKKRESPPPTPSYDSVESFVQHLIAEAVKELHRENMEEQGTRPKSVSFQQSPEPNILYPPTPPKGANPRTRRRVGNFDKQPLYEEDFSYSRSYPKYLRGTTYEEWMMGKKVQKEVQMREQEINKHYDKLQERLFMLEKERRQALLELRQQSPNIMFRPHLGNES